MISRRQTGSVFRRSKRKAARLPALHEIDFEAVLGRSPTDSWSCALCANAGMRIPAAFIKQSGQLEPICTSCLVARTS